MDRNESFAKIELEQAFADIRSHYTILIQITTALIIANITIISYSLSLKNAGLILICSFFPAFIFFLCYYIGKMITPLIYTAISIERHFNLPKVDWVVTTYNINFNSLKKIEKLQTLAEVTSYNDRMKALSKIKIPILGKATKLLYVICAIVISIHLILPFFLVRNYDWNFF